MRILLILPRDTVYRYHGIASKLVGSYAPLTLATLAALVPQELGATIELSDEGIRNPNYANKQYDVVGITCTTASANRAYELAGYWREQGAFVVLGGAHVTLNPDEAQGHADAIVVGLAEESWPRLLRDLKAGTPQRRYHMAYSGQLSSPIPRRDLFPRLGYFPVPTIVANRGCKNHCFFCVVNEGSYSRCVVRPIPEVIDEIRSLRSRLITFLDPNLVSDRDYARRLLEALVPLHLKWMAPAPSDIIYDHELFDLMVRSGCRGLLIGFESLSQASLDRSGKVHNRVSQYREIVKTLHENGIAVLGCFVLGFDDDDPGILKRTAEIVYNLEIDLPRYALLTPFPGSRLYYRLKSEGRLLTEDWSLYDAQHVVFRPKQLEAAELQEIFDNTLRQTYSYRHIFHRVRVSPLGKVMAVMANWGTRQFLLSTLD